MSNNQKISWAEVVYKNNKYIIEVSGDIPNEFGDGIENAYFKFDFNITISDKKTKDIFFAYCLSSKAEQKKIEIFFFCNNIY